MKYSIRFAVFLIATLWAAGASAQTFPSRPISLVIPFSPGGATDVLARMIALPIEKSLGQPVVVENKPGADGLISARYVAAAAPDGHVVSIMSGSSVSWPFFIKSPGVDLIKDFTPLGVIVDGSLAIVASTKTPFNSVKEMIEYAKKNPGKVTWSLPNRSGEPALYGFVLRQKAGIDMLDVVYKGSGPQTTAVIAGEVDVGQFAPGRAVQMDKSNQGKVLAVSGNKREPLLPNTPTMKELGIDGIINYDFELFGPAGMAAPLVERWNAAMQAALKDKVVVEGNAKFGFNAISSTAAQHAAQLKVNYETWRVATQAAKVVPE